MASVALICLSLVIFLICYIVSCEIRYRCLKNVPGPILARYTNAWRCYLAYKHRHRPTGKSFHQIIHERYGNVVRVGPKTAFTCDPDNIPLALGFKQRLEKSDSVKPFMVPGVRTSIVGIRDERVHASYRRPIQGAYSLSSLKAYEPAIDEMIGQLLDVLRQAADKKEIINISAWCHYFSYDTIMKVTFGEAIGFMEKGQDMFDLIAKQVEHVDYVCWVTQMPILDYLLRTNPLILYLRPHKASPFASFAKEKIQEQAKKEKAVGADDDTPRRTLLSHFLDAQQRYPEIVDDVQIRSYCTSNTLAGSLNPSKVMDLICRWLVHHPEAQDRLFEEVRESKRTLPVPLEATLSMPFLEGVVREAYRLHKGADIAIERAVDSTGLILADGTNLEQGVDIGLSTPAMRILPVFGTEPGKFSPERWMRHSDESDAEWKSRRAAMERADLTFGAGSRACLGKNFTHLEIFKAVASIFGSFKIEAVSASAQYNVEVLVQKR